MSQPALNVLGEALQPCCTDPMTGFLRDGYCNTHHADLGTHLVCSVVTEAFLTFTASRGNDLRTPRPEFQFPGLKAGDGWCLCAMRWLEAFEAGVAPPVRLASTHEKVLEWIPLDTLKHAGAP
ncbi:MAG: DUF2237 domain-containing protein [Pseudomonadota bacterium]